MGGVTVELGTKLISGRARTDPRERGSGVPTLTPAPSSGAHTGCSRPLAPQLTEGSSYWGSASWRGKAGLRRDLWLFSCPLAYWACLDLKSRGLQTRGTSYTHSPCLPVACVLRSAGASKLGTALHPVAIQGFYKAPSKLQ